MHGNRHFVETVAVDGKKLALAAFHRLAFGVDKRIFLNRQIIRLRRKSIGRQGRCAGNFRQCEGIPIVAFTQVPISIAAVRNRSRLQVEIGSGRSKQRGNCSIAVTVDIDETAHLPPQPVKLRFETGYLLDRPGQTAVVTRRRIRIIFVRRKVLPRNCNQRRQPETGLIICCGIQRIVSKRQGIFL